MNAKWKKWIEKKNATFQKIEGLFILKIIWGVKGQEKGNVYVDTLQWIKYNTIDRSGFKVINPRF